VVVITLPLCLALLIAARSTCLLATVSPQVVLMISAHTAGQGAVVRSVALSLSGSVVVCSGTDMGPVLSSAGVLVAGSELLHTCTSAASMGGGTGLSHVMCVALVSTDGVSSSLSSSGTWSEANGGVLAGSHEVLHSSKMTLLHHLALVDDEDVVR
jgi:hypothetical protein